MENAVATAKVPYNRYYCEAKYRSPAKVSIRLSVGTREYNGTARRSLRSQLHQSFEASAILPREHEEVTTVLDTYGTPELDRSTVHILHLLVPFIVPIDRLAADLPLRSRPLHTKHVPRRCYQHYCCYRYKRKSYSSHCECKLRNCKPSPI